MEKQNRGRGRPKLPPKERQSNRFHVSLTPADARAVVQRIKSIGVSVSDYLRGLIAQDIGP